MKCPRCQAENREGARFCRECGVTFGAAQQENDREAIRSRVHGRRHDRCADAHLWIALYCGDGPYISGGGPEPRGEDGRQWSEPTSMAFLGSDDILVLEKATGKVQRVVNGVILGAVLDLAVNSASERGLLGIALHPDFPTNPGVYLYWTESTTGADSVVLAEVPLLGNRVDRFVWNGATLTFDHNLIRLHAFQADAGQPLRGNHNGGVLRFGPDRKLYRSEADGNLSLNTTVLGSGASTPAIAG